MIQIYNRPMQLPSRLAAIVPKRLAMLQYDPYANFPGSLPYIPVCIVSIVTVCMSSLSRTGIVCSMLHTDIVVVVVVVVLVPVPETTILRLH